jgi:hypothetical protein
MASIVLHTCILTASSPYHLLTFFSAKLQIVGSVLSKIPSELANVHIEDHPGYLLEALQEALTLVGPVKGYPSFKK